MATQMTPEEIQNALSQYMEEVRNLGEATDDTTKRFKDAQVAIKGYNESLNKSLKDLKDSAWNLGKELKDGAQGAAVYNQTIDTGTKYLAGFLKQIPIFGKYLAAAATAAGDYVQEVNKQSDKLFESYQRLSRVGAAGAGGMQNVFDAMQTFGYNIEQLGDFGNLIKSNSESLALMGGSVNQGVKAFSNMAQGITRSGLDTEFKLLGMNTEDINQGMAGYLRIQTMTGSAQRKNAVELTQGSAEYLRQLDLITKLTCKNAEAQQAESEARLAEQRYIGVTLDLQKKADAARAMGNEADAKRYETQIKTNDALLNVVPKQLKAGVQNIMTGFVGSSKESQQLFMTMPRFSKMLMSQNFTLEQGMEGLNVGLKEGGQKLKDNVGLLKTGKYEDIYGPAGDLFKNMNKDYAKSFEEVKDQQANQILNGDKGVKAQVAMRQEQNEITRAMQTFINQGINPTTVAMQKLSGAVESITSKIPGTGANTGTSGTGRGSEAGASFFGGSPVRGRGGAQFGGRAGAAAGNTANAQRAMAYFISQGYTPAQAAGIVGNLQAESGANLNTSAVGDSGKAVGIAQWHPDRQANFAKFSGKAIGKSSLEEQLAFIAHELKTTEAGAGSRLKGASSAQDAAAVFDQFYERSSGDARRQRMVNAQALLGGPNDSYKTTLTASAPTGSTANSNTVTASQSADKNANDMLGLYKAGQDEMIALLKANNAQNQKILQAARN